MKKLVRVHGVKIRKVVIRLSVEDKMWNAEEEQELRGKLREVRDEALGYDGGVGGRVEGGGV